MNMLDCLRRIHRRISLLRSRELTGDDRQTKRNERPLYRHRPSSSCIGAPKTASLEIELQRHLDLAGRVGRATDGAKAPAIERAVWPAKPRMIEGVEKLRPVLQAHSLS